MRKAQRRLHAKALATFGLVVTSYWCLVLSDLPTVGRLGAAGLLVTALVTVGTSIMHDANHGSFSNHRWLNGLLSFTSDALGASSWLWRFQHNTLHHGNANVAGFDADIALAPIARLSPSQPWHPWYRAQHVYLWPLYGFLALKNLLVSDTVALVTGRLDQQPLRQPVRSRIVAQIAAGKVAHLTWAVVIPLLFNPWWAVLAFYLTCSWIVGFLLADHLSARSLRRHHDHARLERAAPRRRFRPPPAPHDRRHRHADARHRTPASLDGRRPQPPDRASPGSPATPHRLSAPRQTLPAGLPRPQDHLSPPSQHLGSNAFPRSLAANDEHPAQDTIGSNNLPDFGKPSD